MFEYLLSDKEYLIFATTSIIVCFIVMFLFGDPNYWVEFLLVMLVYGVVIIGGRIGYNLRRENPDAPFSK